MHIIYNDVYYRKNSQKCSLFINFWFLDSNSNGNVKSQNPYIYFLVEFAKNVEQY